MDDKNTQSLVPVEIRSFLLDLMNEANIIYSDDEMKEILVEEMYVRLDKFLFSKVLEYLPVEKINDFVSEINDNNTREKTQTYIRENIPNASDFFLVAFAEFRDEYLKFLMETQKTEEQKNEERELHNILNKIKTN